MKVVCLDLEGVLIPEIWEHVARRTQIAKLNLTTRDVKDYSELMNHRIEICYHHGLTLSTIQEYIAELACYEGARVFLDDLRSKYQVIILSDTFYEFQFHFMKLLGYPTLFCHTISFNETTQKIEFALRQQNSKKEAVLALRSLNFKVCAAGDSYNDIHMLKEAHVASFFRAPTSINQEFPQFGNIQSYPELTAFIEMNL